MPQDLSEFLNALSGAAPGAQIGALPFLFLMGISLASSLLIAYLYLHFYATRATGSQVHRAFPLLGISITAIFICIQFSLPLSLGLLGALSIVRFRTPIKEPEEIGFIMLVIAVSIATATFKLAFVGVIFVIALVALVVQRAVRVLRSSTTDGTIVISLPADGRPDESAVVTEIVRRHLARARLESVSRSDRETVLSYNFRSISEPALLALPAEIRGAAKDATFNVFFSRPGAL
jgi:hypothetical protein